MLLVIFFGWIICFSRLWLVQWVGKFFILILQVLVWLFVQLFFYILLLMMMLLGLIVLMWMLLVVSLVVVRWFMCCCVVLVVLQVMFLGLEINLFLLVMLMILLLKFWVFMIFVLVLVSRNCFLVSMFCNRFQFVSFVFFIDLEIVSLVLCIMMFILLKARQALLKVFVMELVLVILQVVIVEIFCLKI